LIIVLVIALAIPLGQYFLKQNIAARGTIPSITGSWHFTHKMIPDLTGKTVVVTGANVGLGKSTAKFLALNGAHVVLGCRSKSKCDQAAKEIRDEAKKDVKLEVIQLDLSSLASFRSFAEEFNKKHSKLDSLILNAGIMHPPFELTADGIESQFGVNHLAHFYLAKLLTPALEQGVPSTVVSVSSNGQFGTYPAGVHVTLEEINNKTLYSPFLAYGQSKLCNVLFAQELADRFSKSGKQIFVNSLNPGGVATDLMRHYPDWVTAIISKLRENFPDALLFEPDTAALTQLYAAISPEIIQKKITGKYFVPIADLWEPSEQAKNSSLQKKLWEFSEKLLQDKGFK